MLDTPLASFAFNLFLPVLSVAIPISWFLFQVKKLTSDEKSNSRAPFSEKLIRPAGESLRLQIDELRSCFSDHFFDLAFFLLTPAIVAIALSSANWLIALSATILAAGICFIFIRKKWESIICLKTEIQNHQLGFHAERVVASELEPLRAAGYQVFHDIVDDTQFEGGEKTFNIDHILVGPEGVFIIETKGKSKVTPSPTSTLKEHELIFDGSELLFPNGVKTKQPITQAKRNADYVEKWLSSSVVGKLPCRAIVAYPGLYVKARNGQLSGVQSAKGLANRIPSLGRGRKLTPHEVTAIAARIKDRCRNVDSF